jgi:hypothetical protein
MTPELQEFISSLDDIQLRYSAERLLQEYLSTEPSEADMETAYAAFAGWLHADHTAA